MPDLRPLLSPDSVVIVGAAGDEHSLRGRLFATLLLATAFPFSRSTVNEPAVPRLRIL